MIVKAVVDTNVWISALHNAAGATRQIAEPFQADKFVLVSASELIAELARALVSLYDVPVHSLFHPFRRSMAQHSLDLDEVESFIRSAVNEETIAVSAYSESRIAKIRELARLCRIYPPPEAAGDDPDFDPSLVPAGWPPYAGGTAMVLQLPNPEKEPGDK